MESLTEDLKKGKMPANCTLYHVSTRELRHPDPNFISTPHEGSRGFNLFCDLTDLHANMRQVSDPEHIT